MLEDDHCTEAVEFLEAVRVVVEPIATDALPGETVTVPVIGVTVTVAVADAGAHVPGTSGTYAVIVVVPEDTPDTRPPELTVATEVDDELHWIEAEELVVPVNCFVLNAGTVDDAGVMVTVGEGLSETVKVVSADADVYLPAYAGTSAWMVVSPGATPVTTPFELTVATEVDEDDQVTPQGLLVVPVSVTVLFFVTDAGEGLTVNVVVFGVTDTLHVVDAEV